MKEIIKLYKDIFRAYKDTYLQDPTGITLAVAFGFIVYLIGIFIINKVG